MLCYKTFNLKFRSMSLKVNVLYVHSYMTQPQAENVLEVLLKKKRSFDNLSEYFGHQGSPHFSHGEHF